MTHAHKLGTARPSIVHSPTTTLKAGLFAILLRAAIIVAALVSVAFAVGPVSPSTSVPPRIVNGVLTHDYPAVGAVLRGDFPDRSQHVPITADTASMFCSGTLIGCRTFLTAGHCTGQLDADEAWVYLPHAGIFTVTSIARHPEYAVAAAGVSINDVAVLKLGEPVTGIAPMPINLADPNPFIPAAGTIVGFGSTGGAGAVVAGIKRVGYVETTTCLPELFPAVPDPAAQLVCWDFLDPIGPPGEDSDTCYGDSGGPLFLDLGNGLVVAGVTTSGTNSSCLPTDHVFDANVYTYRDFLLTELGTDATITCGRLPPVGAPHVDVFGFDGQLDDTTPSATYTVDVVAGRTSARFTLNAQETATGTAPQGTFDVNMYVKAGPGASPTDFDCKADAASVFGACIFEPPAAASYSVFLQRVAGAGDYQLTATAFNAAPRSKMQRLCAKAIRDSFTRFFKAKLAAQQTCIGKVNKGKGIPPCPDAKAAAAIAKAASKIDPVKLGKKCPVEVIPTMALSGSCANAANADDLAACIVSETEAAVDALLAVEYSQPETVLSSTDEQKCQAAVAQVAGKRYAAKRLRILSTCLTRRDTGKVASCPDPSAADRLTKAVAKVAPAIGKKCSDAVVQALNSASFGGSCATATTVAAVASCQVAEHDAVIDDAMLGRLQ